MLPTRSAGEREVEEGVIVFWKPDKAGQAIFEGILKISSCSTRHFKNI